MPNQYLPGVIAIPSSLLIIAATQSCPMAITVSVGNPLVEDNSYSVGMSVRLFVPKSYGMYQANGLIGTIKAISGSAWALNIDSSLFDAFVIPSSTEETPASVSPNGSRNLEYNNSTGLVPFQSLNNIGN